MINALHLLWIVPLSVFFGMVIVSMMSISADAGRRMDELLNED